MTIARRAFLAAFSIAALTAGTMTANAQQTHVTLATATPGGGFPLYGDALAAAINETDTTFQIRRRATPKAAPKTFRCWKTTSSTSHWSRASRPTRRLRHRTADHQSQDRYRDLFQSGHVRRQRRQSGDAAVPGRTADRGNAASGLTLLARYVMDGLGLDREKDFQPVYLDKAGDGPAMVLDGRVAALWGGGIGWPGFTAVTQAGGRLVGLALRCRAHPQEAQFLKTTHRAGGDLSEPDRAVTSVGSWSFVLARASLEHELAYRLAKSIHRSYNTLVKRVAQGHETTPQNTVAAAPRVVNIHSGVQKYLREIGSFAEITSALLQRPCDIIADTRRRFPGGPDFRDGGIDLASLALHPFDDRQVHLALGHGEGGCRQCGEGLCGNNGALDQILRRNNTSSTQPRWAPASGKHVSPV